MATTTTKNQELMDELARVLGCKPPHVPARLDALGLTETCTRCGGSGSYSFNYMHGSVCYGCSGSGRCVPRLTRRLVERAAEGVAAGGLREYLDRVALRSKARRAQDAAMKAWRETRVAKAYSKWPTVRIGDRWAFIQETNPRLFAANSRMCALWDEASKLGARLEHGDWSHETRAYVKLDGPSGDAVARRMLEIPADIVALDYEPEPIPAP